MESVSSFLYALLDATMQDLPEVPGYSVDGVVRVVADTEHPRLLGTVFICDIVDCQPREGASASHSLVYLIRALRNVQAVFGD
jgi:hypothetical protein